MRVADDPSHADRFEECVIESRGAPSCGPVWADGDDATVCLGFASDIQHHFAVVQFDRDGLVGVDPLFRARHCDVTGFPCPALVIADDGGCHAWTMRVASFAGGKPDRHHKSA